MLAISISLFWLIPPPPLLLPYPLLMKKHKPVLILSCVYSTCNYQKLKIFLLLGIGEPVVVRLIDPILDNEAGIPSSILPSPARLRRFKLAESSHES